MQDDSTAGQEPHRNTSAGGNLDRTARMATELAETSHELQHYLSLNSALLQRDSHEVLHVQSLAAQLVQMSK